MTHDELIAYIDGSTNGLKHEDLFEKLLGNTKALRAVVELHKPMLWKNLGNDTDGWKCEVCEGKSYPCSTVQAIEKELG